MQKLKEFTQRFLQNKGQYIFISLLIAKICAFLSSLLIIRLLPESEFGKIGLVASIFALFSSATGFGSHQSLLRFGSISETPKDKNALSAYLFKQGFYYQVILSVLFLASSIFFVSKFEDIFWIFFFFSIRLIGVYFQNHIQSYFRISGENSLFAKSNNVLNVGGLIAVVLFTKYFGLYGYLFAVSFTPFLALFWYKNYMVFHFSQLIFTRKELWNYAYHTAGTALLSDALFAMDTVILGFLANESAVAQYKVAVMLPMNVTFLALVVMQTDFPSIAKNHSNKVFLKDYIFNYYKIFLPICVVLFFVGFYGSRDILQFFFNGNYASQSQAFSILWTAFLFNLLFRNLFGNLLSATGLMKVNTFVSLISIVVLCISGFALVPKLGVLGMALSLGGSLVLSGLILMVFFYRHLHTLK